MSCVTYPRAGLSSTSFCQILTDVKLNRTLIMVSCYRSRLSFRRSASLVVRSSISLQNSKRRLRIKLARRQVMLTLSSSRILSVSRKESSSTLLKETSTGKLQWHSSWVWSLWRWLVNRWTADRDLRARFRCETSSTYGLNRTCTLKMARKDSKPIMTSWV